MKNNPKYIIIHTTDYSYQKMEDQFIACDGWHKDRWNKMVFVNDSWKPASEGLTNGLPWRYMTDSESKQFGTLSSLNYYIGYHRVITGDKNYQARLDTDEGAHCNQSENGLSINFQSLGIAIGFDGDIEMPTPKQYELLQQQVWAWQDQYNIPPSKVRFHRYYATNKTCPGSLITDQWLMDLLKRPLPPPLVEKSDPCIAVVEEKNRYIWNLRDLIKSLINIKIK